MEIEHLYIWTLSRKGLSDVGLRVLLYLQIVHKVTASPERRIIFVSRRRICKKLAVSVGACRSAVKQLVDLGFITMSDSKGNPIEDLSSNFMILNPKEKLNWPMIKGIIDQLNSPDGADRGSADGPATEGLFDNIMNE